MTFFKRISHICPLPPPHQLWKLGLSPLAPSASPDVYEIEKSHAGQLPLQKGSFYTCHVKGGGLEGEDTDLTGSQLSELAPLLLALLLGDEWRPPKGEEEALAAGRGWIQCSEALTGMLSPVEGTWNLGSLSGWGHTWALGK